MVGFWNWKEAGDHRVRVPSALRRKLRLGEKRRGSHSEERAGGRLGLGPGQGFFYSARASCQPEGS